MQRHKDKKSQRFNHSWPDVITKVQKNNKNMHELTCLGGRAPLLSQLPVCLHHKSEAVPLPERRVEMTPERVSQM